MHIWTDAEIQCSGKLSDMVRCSNTFSAKVQMCVSDSLEDKTASITGVSGEPPEDWMSVRKPYITVPRYYCFNCTKQGIRFESRP